MTKQQVFVESSNGNIRGTLYDFVVKFDVTYGLVDFGGGKIEEVELDKIKIMDKI